MPANTRPKYHLPRPPKVGSHGGGLLLPRLLSPPHPFPSSLPIQGSSLHLPPSRKIESFLLQFVDFVCLVGWTCCLSHLFGREFRDFPSSVRRRRSSIRRAKRRLRAAFRHSLGVPGLGRWGWRRLATWLTLSSPILLLFARLVGAVAVTSWTVTMLLFLVCACIFST